MPESVGAEFIGIAASEVMAGALLDDPVLRRQSLALLQQTRRVRDQARAFAGMTDRGLGDETARELLGQPCCRHGHALAKMICLREMLRRVRIPPQQGF